MINNQERELKLGQMEQDMKENIKMVEKKDMEFYTLLMDLNIQGFLPIMKYMDMEFMNGQMVEYIKEIGNRIR